MMRGRSPSVRAYSNSVWTDEHEDDYIANVMTEDLPCDGFHRYGDFDDYEDGDKFSNSDSSYGYPSIPTPSTNSHLPVSPVAATFAPAAPSPLDQLMDTSESSAPTGPFQAAARQPAPRLTEVMSPLYQYHALNLPPTVSSSQSTAAPTPHVISTTTPTPDTDLAAEVRSLKHLFNCHSRQLAAQQQHISSVEHKITYCENEITTLHSILGYQASAVQEITDDLERANKRCVIMQKEMNQMDSQYRRASREMEKTRSQEQASKGGKVHAGDSDTKLESMAETQKMQSTSITAVVGQVGALDRALQTIPGSLAKEIQALVNTVSEQGQKITELEGNREAMKKHAQAQETTNKQLREEIKALTRGSEALDGAIKSFTNDIASLNNQCSQLRSAVQRIDKNVDKLQGDVKGVQMNARQQSVEQDATRDQVRRNIADLTKRADEAVVVTDARSAALETKIAELRDEVTATEEQTEHQHRQSATPEYTDALNAIRTTVTKMAEQLSGLELETLSLSKEFDECKDDVDMLVRNRGVSKSDFGSAMDKLNKSREVFSQGLMDLRKKMDELEIRQRDAGWDAASEVALGHIDDELSALRNITDSLAQTCKFPTTTSATLGDFVTSSVNEMAKKARDSQASEVSNITSALDQLRRDLSNMATEQDDKITTAIAHSSEQSSLTRDFMSSMDDLNRRVDEALGNHDIQTSVLTTRVDELAVQYQNRNDIRNEAVTQGAISSSPSFSVPHLPTTNHISVSNDDSNLSAASRATVQARTRGLARGGVGSTRGAPAMASMRGRGGGGCRPVLPGGFSFY